jgi:cytochrome b subunit of formate dehydrogenase
VGDTAVAGAHRNLIFAAHKLVTIAAAVRAVDHRYTARVNGGTRHALRGTLTGEADRQWAREHHPHWEP